MHKGVKTALRTGVSLALLAGIMVFLVDWPRAWQVVRGGNWLLLSLLPLWMLLDRLLMSYKWRLLLTCRGYGLGHWESFKAYLLATFAGSFLPSTLGADAVRVVAVTRTSGVPSDVVAASVFLERALGFVAAALAAVMALVLLAGLTTELPRQAVYWSWGLLALGAVAILASLSQAAGRAHRWLEEKLAGRHQLLVWTGKFLGSYHNYRGHRGVLAWVLFLSLVEQGAPVVGNWLAARALHLDLTLVQAAAVTPVAILLARLPVSSSAFGVLEGLFVAFFGLVGLAPTGAFLLGFIQNLSTLVTGIPGLFIYLAGGITLKKPPETGA
ncbi:MAG: flippase-like domain-containing protein [Deltaproteobacteria bacterium]|nr:flippase-like domain-containing protein [Deltaproteobacteria bacterium]